MKDVVEETQIFTGLDIYNLIGNDSTDTEELNHPLCVGCNLAKRNFNKE